MSAISGFINTIRNAVYGEQVRGAIADAITQCYDDVTNPSLNTAAFAAAIEAAYEDGFLDIQEKSTIAGMTNEKIIYRYTGNAAGYVHNALYYYDGTAWRPIGSGIQTASTAAQMTDTNAIYKYTGSETGYTNGAIYYYNGSAWTAIAKQSDIDTILSGILVYKNVFNPNDAGIEENKKIVSGGTISAQSGYNVSGYVPVEAGTYAVHVATNYSVIQAYNSEKTRVGEWSSGTLKTDANGIKYKVITIGSAAYIRFTYYAEYHDKIMVVKLSEMPSKYGVYNEITAELKGTSAETKTIEVEMEGGTISDSNGREGNSINYFNTRHRSKYYIATGGASTMSINLGKNSASAVYVARYDSNKELIEALSNEENIKKINIGIASYVRIVLVLSESNSELFPISVTFKNASGVVKQAKKPNLAEFASTYQILYPLSKDICNTGRLALPPNYDSEGKAVPLVVFMHGSGHYVNWDAIMDNYNNKNQFIQQSGFAVLELYSWTSKYYNKYGTGLNGCDPYPMKITLDAYREGIKYVCDCWNIDINNIHVMSKSQGGGLAYYFVNYAPFPIRSIGMFSPVLDYFSMNGAGGAFGAPRRAIVEELGLEGNAEDNFINSITYSESCVEFWQNNIERANSINGAWQGLIGQTLQEKFDASIENGSKWWSNKNRDDVYTDYDLVKLGKYPVKIWGTPTDEQTPYQKMVEAVKQLNNGGCEAHLRTFPTGGHGVCDGNAENAGYVETNVTTRLGVTFSSVPTAYVENLEWMLLHMNEVEQSSS